MEIWKNMYGWEDLYEISNLGNIKSKQRNGKTMFGERAYGGNVVNPIKTSSGYPAVNLTKSGVRKQMHIHVLVLETFVGKRPDKYEACHNNGNRLDYRLDNLRWDTRKNNHADMHKHGTAQIGKNANRPKLNKYLASEIKTSNLMVKELAEKYGVSKTQIWRIKTNKSWDI